MSLNDQIENLNLNGDCKVEDQESHQQEIKIENPKSSLDTRTFITVLQPQLPEEEGKELTTDILISRHSDRVLIVATCFKKPGTLVEVVKSGGGGDREGSGNVDVYSSRILVGLQDKEEARLAGRFLAQTLQLQKTLILGLGFPPKYLTLPLIQSLTRFIKDNY